MSAATLEVYRRIGPFDATTLPKGLLSEHRLKAGSWGRVTVLSGRVDFVWDDGSDLRATLELGDCLLVPPQVPHHLEITSAFQLSIDFMREA